MLENGLLLRYVEYNGKHTCLVVGRGCPFYGGKATKYRTAWREGREIPNSSGLILETNKNVVYSFLGALQGVTLYRRPLPGLINSPNPKFTDHVCKLKDQNST